MRSNTLTAIVLLASTLTIAADTAPRTFTFGKESLDKLPSGWKADHTGKDGGGLWKVVADDTAPSKSGCVLSQTGESPNAAFNLCVVEDTRFDDVAISVAFKANKGKKDQGGGIVWRYIDANNYFISRFNPLEDNFRVYKVVAGKRIQLATKEEIKIPAGEWHSLSIKMVGPKIECSLDGKKLLEASDDTFPKAGKIGLWTKADAQSSFDQLKVEALTK